MHLTANLICCLSRLGILDARGTARLILSSLSQLRTIRKNASVRVSRTALSLCLLAHAEKIAILFGTFAFLIVK